MHVERLLLLSGVPRLTLCSKVLLFGANTLGITMSSCYTGLRVMSLFVHSNLLCSPVYFLWYSLTWPGLPEKTNV